MSSPHFAGIPLSLLSNLGSLRFFLSKLFSSALEDLVEVILAPSDIGTQASELPLKHNIVSDKSPRSIRRERKQTSPSTFLYQSRERISSLLIVRDWHGRAEDTYVYSSYVHGP